MIEPFEGTNIIAHLRYPEKEIRKEMHEFTQMGFAIKAHGIGDRAIRLLLDIFKE